MRKRRVIVLTIAGMLAAIGVGGWCYRRWMFPYGQSHCCILQVMSALEVYAGEHGGRYPAGESTPEASLSLLYRSGDLDPYTLRGMIVPEAITRSMLQRGGLLTPESCGWHYVEDLTEADDRRLALLWCKQPLGHNGNRTPDGGRQVGFVGGDVQFISGRRWPAFLEEQGELLTRRSAGARAGARLVVGMVEFPDGTRTDRVDAAYTMTEESKGPGSSGTGTSSGRGLGRAELVWYQAPLPDGSFTRTLSFSNLVSEPVTVTFVGGVPDVTNYVFRMRSKR